MLIKYVLQKLLYHALLCFVTHSQYAAHPILKLKKIRNNLENHTIITSVYNIHNIFTLIQPLIINNYKLCEVYAFLSNMIYILFSIFCCGKH